MSSNERATFPVVVHVLFNRITNGVTEYCLCRRSGTGFMDGWYTLPGGHQEFGESLVEAATRECLEEVGVRPRELQPLAALGYRSARHQGLNFVFRCTVWDGELRLAEPVFDQLVWVPEGAFPRPFAPWIEQAIALPGRGTWLDEIVY